MPLPLWSPSEVLQLDPHSSGFTCIGHAPSKGRRCHNPIAYANRQEAANILKEMSTLDPHSKRLDKRFEKLAPRLLCQKWHQNQAADMKALWRREIDRHFPATVRIERYTIVERYTVVYAPSVAPSSTTVRTRAIGQSTSLLARSPVPAFALEPLPVTTITETRARATRSNDLNRQESRQQAEPSPTSSNQPDSTLQERTLPEPNSPPMSPVTEPARPTPNPAAPQETTPPRADPPHERPPPEPIHIPAPTQNPNPHEDPLPLSARRAIEGDCSICCEELGNGDATVWCKAQCRQNFHEECIETWHGTQEVLGRRRGCPYW